MSVFPRGVELFEATYGIVVSEPARALPATAALNIFTVTGRVILTTLTGQVTTAIGATAVTLSAGFTPAGGSLSAAAIATATAITSAPVGSLVSVAMPAGPLVLSTTGVIALGGASIDDQTGLVLGTGNINISTSATTTGALSWTMTYVPYDAGANVTAV